MPAMIRFDVYGRVVGVLRDGGRWRAVFVGEDGKHRDAPGVVIPPDLDASELAGHLADVFHESARPERPDVVLPRAAENER